MEYAAMQQKQNIESMWNIKGGSDCHLNHWLDLV